MLWTIVVAAVSALLTCHLQAEPVHVAAVTKQGRYTGTLPIDHVEVEVGARVVKVPLADVSSLHVGEPDVVRTRQGKPVTGRVRVDGRTCRAPNTDRLLPLRTLGGRELLEAQGAFDAG